MKEVKTNIPEGYELDNENSTVDCIKLKKTLNRWRYNKESIVIGFYIDTKSQIIETGQCYNKNDNYNVFATKALAESALAMARISQIIANDKRFGGFFDKPLSKESGCWTIIVDGDSFAVKYGPIDAIHFPKFSTREQTELFIKENNDLLRQYFML